MLGNAKDPELQRTFRIKWQGVCLSGKVNFNSEGSRSESEKPAGNEGLRMKVREVTGTRPEAE